MNIIDNLMAARRIIEAAPPEIINLETYGEKREGCGTLYCALGLLAASNQFPGVNIAWGSPILGGMMFANITNDNGDVIDNSELDAVFGKKSFERLFNQRGDGHFDFDLTLDDLITDHELALRRIDQQILTLRREELKKGVA